MHQGLTAPPLYIGTSGWNYEHWRESFYGNIRRKDWLPYCAEHFTGIEINATFYRLQTRATFARWREQTPAGFHFTVKGNRFLTHNKKLREPHPIVRVERERAEGLGSKLTAVLWQLPHNFHLHIDRLEEFAAALRSWSTVRHTIEFRHSSWFVNDVADCLQRHGIAACLSDAADWPMWNVLTTDFVYVRLHGHTRTYVSAYSSTSLQHWAQRIGHWRAEGRTVHVYFDNDGEGAAPRDALRLLEYADHARGRTR